MVSLSPSTGIRKLEPGRFARLVISTLKSCTGVDTHTAPTTVPQTVTTTRTGQQQQYGNRGAPQSQIKPDQNNGNTFRAAAADCSPQEPIAKRIAPPANGVRSKPGDKSVNRLDGHTPSASIPYQDSNTNDLKTYAHDAPREQGEYDAALVRQKSIPRKQIGTSAQVPYPSAESSAIPSSHISHGRQKSASKSLPSTSLSSGNGYEARKMEAPPQPASILNRSRPITRDSAKPRDGQQVVNRAKSNTYDTEVIEKVAPGKYLPFCSMSSRN